MLGWAMKPPWANRAASMPEAAALPQWVHLTIEPVLADSPEQRDVATPKAWVNCSAVNPRRCEAAAVDPVTPTTPGVWKGSEPRAWAAAASTRPCISNPFAQAVTMSRPLLPSASPSANATGTVGETACVGGLDIGSKSSTCIDAALAKRGVRGRGLQTEAPDRAPLAAALLAHVVGDERRRGLATSCDRDRDPVGDQPLHHGDGRRIEILEAKPHDARRDLRGVIHRRLRTGLHPRLAPALDAATSSSGSA
jgi:hypothetical protein